MNFPTIPNLPTDNLYKFQALASLLALILSTLGASYIAFDVSRDLSRSKAEYSYKAFKRTMDSLMISSDTISIKDNLNFELKNSKTLRDSIVAQQVFANRMLHKLDSLRKRGLVEADEWKEEYIERIASSDINGKRLNLALVLCLFSLMFSIITRIYFRQWYTNHQKYQDKILRDQAYPLKKDIY